MNSTPVPQAPYLNRPHRPFGLKALIALLMLQAVVSVVVVLSLVFADQVTLSQLSPTDTTPLAKITLIIFYAAFFLARIGVAIGLWRLRRWAWVGMMVLLAGSMAMDLRNYYCWAALLLLDLVESVITMIRDNLREIAGH